MPDPARYTFLDLGCGKGRGLIVASERPFRRVVGLEIDSALTHVARANAAIIRSRFPNRTPIEVLEGNVASLAYPSGDTVAFMYHAFSVDLLRTVIAKLVSGANGHRLFVIYQNPLFSHILDAEPRLRRWFTETVKCEPAEVGVGSGSDEMITGWVLRDYWAVEVAATHSETA